MTADEATLVATVQGQLQDAMNFEGSSEEKQVRALMATIGLDYDTLTKEEFVSIISGLKKSKYLKSPINQRGKARPQLSHGKGKRKGSRTENASVWLYKAGRMRLAIYKFKSSISCVSTSAYCSAWRFGCPDESSST